jgi:hypothetical protein
LKAGPVWDFDWAWKTMATCSLFDQNDGSGWAHLINDCPTDNYSCGYYVRLLQDTTFSNELRCAYEEYRSTILDTTYLFAYMDSIENIVQKAQARHFQKWPILGVSGPAPEVNNIATTYAAEMDTLKNWIKVRLNWLDTHIPGHCIQVNTGITQTKVTEALQYYPNPSTGNFHFEGTLSNGKATQMTIYDITNKVIDKIPIKTGKVKFEYRLKQKGVYFFNISNEEGIIQFGKLLVI